MLRSTSLRKSLCRACSAVQRLLGSSVSMWSSRSSADEGMLCREWETAGLGAALNGRKGPQSGARLRPKRNPCSQNLLLHDAAAQRHQQNEHWIPDVFSLIFAIDEEQLCPKSHETVTHSLSPPQSRPRGFRRVEGKRGKRYSIPPGQLSQNRAESHL